MDDPDTEAARRHFVAGAALYDDAKYAEAIVELAAARRLRPSPALDYNIARCHDRLEHTADAVEWYQRFLEHASPGTQTDEANTRLAVLRARLAEQAVVPAGSAVPVGPVVAPVAAIETHGPRHRYAVAVPAAVTSLALASLVAGGALYGVSGSKYDDLTNAGCGTRVSCFDSRWGATRSLERAGVGLLITGGVLSAASVALWAGYKAR
jgi:tetratricopeptide (TPR) repeat protein